MISLNTVDTESSVSPKSTDLKREMEQIQYAGCGCKKSRFFLY